MMDYLPNTDIQKYFWWMYRVEDSKDSTIRTEQSRKYHRLMMDLRISYCVEKGPQALLWAKEFLERPLHLHDVVHLFFHGAKGYVEPWAHKVCLSEMKRYMGVRRWKTLMDTLEVCIEMTKKKEIDDILDSIAKDESEAASDTIIDFEPIPFNEVMDADFDMETLEVEFQVDGGETDVLFMSGEDMYDILE